MLVPFLLYRDVELALKQRYRDAAWCAISVDGRSGVVSLHQGAARMN
jgi:hypothetical protein